MRLFRQELAISAVAYDTAFVEDLITRLTPLVGARPVWETRATLPPTEDAGEADALDNDVSRVALILHQRLWSRDDCTRRDAEVLRRRLRARPRSIRVVSLDASPIPAWLEAAPHMSLDSAGIDGIAEFLLDAIAACGGLRQHVPAVADVEPLTRWNNQPPSFLAQPRAFSALRRELDELSSRLAPLLKTEGNREPDQVAELRSLPHRLVVQLGAIGLSFSWVAGRLGTVEDGRLLVIEWDHVAGNNRTLATLADARRVRECVYRVEATGPESWRWRADEANGRAYTTSNLAGEWFAGAIAAAETQTEVVAS